MKHACAAVFVTTFLLSANVFAASTPKDNELKSVPPGLETNALRMPLNDACAVWLREKGFAEALEKHDAAAFSEHIDTDAIFLDIQGKQTIGRAAIAADWADLLDGSITQLRWHPRDVAVDSQRGLAVSRGPYTVERTHPEPRKPALYGGIFSSFWIKNKDGVWRALFDAGSGPRPMTAQEAEHHMLTSAECPY